MKKYNFKSFLFLLILSLSILACNKSKSTVAEKEAEVLPEDIKDGGASVRPCHYGWG